MMTQLPSDLTVHGRVVLIGDSSVGKTSIVNRLIDERFNANEQTTVGANWQLYSTVIDGMRVEFQIWDTAGQEKFRSLGPLYYRNALGAVAVFDVTSRPSFENIGGWITAFTAVAGAETVVVIAANKCDAEGPARRVGAKEAIDWATECGAQVFETSAMTGQNVKQLFEALAEEVVHLQPKRQKKKTEELAAAKNTSGCC
jgi:small GTP-binding protein